MRGDHRFSAECGHRLFATKYERRGRRGESGYLEETRKRVAGIYGPHPLRRFVQRAFDPVHHTMFRCQIGRDTIRLMRGAGFEIQDLDNLEHAEVIGVARKAVGVSFAPGAGRADNGGDRRCH